MRVFRGTKTEPEHWDIQFSTRNWKDDTGVMTNHFCSNKWSWLY